MRFKSLALLVAMGLIGTYLKYGAKKQLLTNEASNKVSVEHPSSDLALSHQHTLVERKPEISTQENTAPTRKGTSQVWEPSGADAMALDRSQKVMADWEKKRADFLENTLSETDLNTLSALRNDTIKVEEELMERTSSSDTEEDLIRDNLMKNRRAYEEKLKTTLGSNWKAYLVQFGQFWQINGDSERVALHQPMK